jgi:riboflavin synthase
MFTGIIEKNAKVKVLKARRGGKQLVLQAPAGWTRLPLGSSIAVDGACLTVASRKKGFLSFDLLKETLKRTRFSSLQAGAPLNLERAMRSTQRIDGHIVQGHVDAVGIVRRIVRGKRERSLLLSFPKALKPYIVSKGSIAVNGVSLTVGRVQKDRFWVHVIPATLRRTNLGLLQRGDQVNLEGDALLKFFHQLTRSKANYKLRLP